MFRQTLKNVHRHSPIVHCITNYVTVNDVANIVLASGASPIMADDIEEVSDIVSISNSLVINIGTLNSMTINSMIAAGKSANKINNPTLLDPVGIGASNLRTQTTFQLLEEVEFSVIKGNASEIKSIFNGSRTSGGVDVSPEDTINKNNIDIYIKIAQELNKIYNSVIVITGPVDIVAGSKKTYLIKNGHKVMANVTGTGCMLSGLIGAFIGGNPDNIIDSVATAVVIMGLCGELANQDVVKYRLGTGSLRTYIIDYISKINAEMIDGGMKIESR